MGAPSLRARVAIVCAVACAIGLAGCPHRVPTLGEGANDGPPELREGQGTPGSGEDNGEPHTEPDLVGVTHIVLPGQTLFRIAKTYQVDERELAELNDIEHPEDLKAGQALFIPGADHLIDVPPGPTLAPQSAVEQQALAKQPRYAWPVHGLLMSRFGIRGPTHHDGIDVAAPEGTPVTAAAAGKVIFAGEQHGYGRLAIVDHGGGEATVYAHCEVVLVQVGQEVRAGQTIARVGRTGRATGPHLHFEVRIHAQPRNPLFYLPDH